MIFVDTNAWFASMVPWDQNHAAATAWLATNSQELFTTDYVADETLTLLRVRGERALGEQFGAQLFAGHLATLYYATEADIVEAWRVYRQFSDKEWSFTDCTSKVIIESLKIKTAFSFDQHFRQFGSVVVVP